MKAVRQQWVRLWEMDTDAASFRWWHLLLRISVLLAIYVLADHFFMRTAGLNSSAYEGAFIYAGYLKQLFSGHRVLLVVIALLGFGALFFLWPGRTLQDLYRRLGCRWSRFDHQNAIRVLAVLTAVILTWVHSTYDYNLYYDQSHFADRLLLWLMIPLLWWRPVFIIPFLTLLIPVIGQFEALPGYSWAAPVILIRVLVISVAFYLLHVLTGRTDLKEYVLLLGCLIASPYYVSGIGKLNWDWILYDRIYYLLPAAYLNGWWGFVEPDTISTMTRTAALFNVPMKIFTLVVEAGAIFLFWNRYTVRFFLLAWILFHLGIFCASGIFFWMWISIEFILLIFLSGKGPFSKLALFNRKYFILSLLLIAGANYWFKPVKLAWFDVPVSYTYRFEAQTESGKMLRLSPEFFAPYDYQFTPSSFSYLNPNPVLNVAWGTTGDKELFAELRKVQSVEQILDLEKSHGYDGVHTPLAEHFDQLVIRFISNWNRRLSKALPPFTSFPAPRLLWTFPPESHFKKPEAIRKVTVIHASSFYTRDRGYREFRSVPVREIQIPPP